MLLNDGRRRRVARALQPADVRARSLATSKDGAPTPPISLRYPPQPAASPSFDALGDAIYLGEAVVESDNWWNRLSTMSYSAAARPTMGAATAAALDKWLDHGLSLGRQGRARLPLPLRADDALALRPHPPHRLALHLGALLVRCCRPRDHKRKDELMSILRVLSLQPAPRVGHAALRGQPPLQDYRMLKSSDMLKTLFDAVREYLVKPPVERALARRGRPTDAVVMIKVKPLRADRRTQRRLARRGRPRFLGQRRTHAARRLVAAPLQLQRRRGRQLRRPRRSRPPASPTSSPRCRPGSGAVATPTRRGSALPPDVVAAASTTRWPQRMVNGCATTSTPTRAAGQGRRSSSPS